MGKTFYKIHENDAKRRKACRSDAVSELEIKQRKAPKEHTTRISQNDANLSDAQQCEAILIQIQVNRDIVKAFQTIHEKDGQSVAARTVARPMQNPK
jgi:hypothetical protein